MPFFYYYDLSVKLQLQLSGDVLRGVNFRSVPQDGTHLTGIAYLHMDAVQIDDGEYLAFFLRYRSHAPT